MHRIHAKGRQALERLHNIFPTVEEWLEEHLPVVVSLNDHQVVGEVRLVDQQSGIPSFRLSSRSLSRPSS